MLSVNHVEDWEIVGPSFHRFPTVPNTFDEVYWETYWNIVHQPDQMVLGIIKKIDDNRREIENKQTADQKQNIEKEKVLDRLYMIIGYYVPGSEMRKDFCVLYFYFEVL